MHQSQPVTFFALALQAARSKSFRSSQTHKIPYHKHANGITLFQIPTQLDLLTSIDLEIMLTTRERDGIGEILFQEVSLLEPELAEVLTSMMLEMEDEDILTL